MSNQQKTLVLGANGFLGSHVTKALVKDGRRVRALVRNQSADTRNIKGLDVELVYGEALEKEAITRAMRGCDSVFHCMVDTRAWLRDATPLYRVNVDGLRNSMEAALETGVQRFVFTSTVCTIGRNPSGIATEADAFNWHDIAPHYVMSRVKAEELFDDFCKRGLPGVACNVAMTWGERDFQPTPHGWLLKTVVRGWVPVYWDMRQSMVGIDDAARALILAEQRGRVGERYIVADRFMTWKEVVDVAARHAGRSTVRLRLPMPLMFVICRMVERVAHLLGQETILTLDTLRLSFVMNEFDSSKARSELGWAPRPVEESIRAAVEWFRKNP